MKVRIPKLTNKPVASYHSCIKKTSVHPLFNTTNTGLSRHSFLQNQTWNPFFLRTFATVKQKDFLNSTSNRSVIEATIITMQRYIEQGYLEAALKEWTNFSKGNWKANAKLFALVMNIYAQLGDLPKLEKLWKHMVSQNVPADYRHYGARIICHCNTGDLHRAELDCHAMKQRDFAVDPEIHLALLKSYALHDPDSPRVDALYSELKSDNYAAHATAIMMGIKVQKDLKNAIEYLEELKSENLLSDGVYHELIAGCKDFDLAQKYTKEMEDAGFKKSAATCLALMQVCKDSPEKLGQIFDEYRAHGGATPRNFKFYLSSVASHGNLDDIKKALQLMQESAVPYTTDLFDSIFSTLNQRQAWELTQQVVDLMKQYKVPLHPSTYSIIISTYGKAGLLIEMNQALEEYRLNHSDVTREILIQVIESAYYWKRYDMVCKYYPLFFSKKIDDEPVIHKVLLSYVLTYNWNQLNILLARLHFDTAYSIPFIDTLTKMTKPEDGIELIFKMYFKINKIFPMCVKIFAVMVTHEKYLDAIEVLRDIVANRRHYNHPSFRLDWNYLLQNVALLNEVLEREAYHGGVKYIQHAVNHINQLLTCDPVMNEGKKRVLPKILDPPDFQES